MPNPVATLQFCKALLFLVEWPHTINYVRLCGASAAYWNMNLAVLQLNKYRAWLYWTRVRAVYWERVIATSATGRALVRQAFGYKNRGSQVCILQATRVKDTNVALRPSCKVM
jgi:hypothetical protein